MSAFEDQLSRVHSMMFHQEFTADQTNLEYLYHHITCTIQQSGNGAILLEELSQRRYDEFSGDAVLNTVQQHLHSGAWHALLTPNLAERTPNGWGQQFSLPLAGSGYAKYHWYDVPTMLRENPSVFLLSTTIRDQQMHDVASALLHWVVHSGTARQVIGVLSDTAKQLDLPGSRRANIVEHVVTRFFVATFDQTTHEYVVDRETPWVWQQPIFVNTWTEALRDVETMQGIYDLFRDRPGYGYHVLSED